MMAGSGEKEPKEKKRIGAHGTMYT